MSLRAVTKGACRHISTPTLKSVMELRKSVVKSESYLEGEAKSPLYRCALEKNGEFGPGKARHAPST